MYKIIISAFLLMLGLSSNVSMIQANGHEFLQNQNELIVYESETFSIEYPRGWGGSSNSNENAEYVAFSPQPLNLTFEDFSDFTVSTTIINTIQTDPMIGVLSLPLNPLESIDLQELVEAGLDDLDVIRTEVARPITIGNAQGVEVIAIVNGQESLRGGTFGGHLVAIQSPTQVLFFLAAAPQTIFAEYQVLFSQMVNSITLTESDSAITQNSAPNLAPNAELPSDNGIEYMPYTASGFTIDYPIGWFVSHIETFDGSLTLFSPIPIEIFNEDFENLIDLKAPNNPALVAAILQQPIFVVITTASDNIRSYNGNPLDWMLLLDERYFEREQLIVAREIMINNTMATELSVIVRGDEQLSDFSLGSRNLMVDVFGQVTFASGVIRGDLFFQYDPIFTRMAYSLQIQ